MAEVGKGMVFISVHLYLGPPWAPGQPWESPGSEGPSLSALLSVFLPRVVFGLLPECVVPFSLFPLLASHIYLPLGS